MCLFFSSLSVLILFFMKTEERTEDERADDVEPLFENDTDKSHDNKVGTIEISTRNIFIWNIVI